MSEIIESALPYATVALFVLAALAFVVAFHLFRRSRTDVFWRRRRDAGQRGWRLFVLGSGLLASSAVACLFTLLIALLGNHNDSAPPATMVAAQNGTPPAMDAPTLAGADITPNPDTPRGTTPASPEQAETPNSSAAPIVVIITTTPMYTPSDTPFPTFTPVATPLFSTVTPLPNAELKITALDDQISDTLKPVNPRTTFPAGTRRIYLFVEFRAMTQGVLWERALFRDGELLDSGEYLWGSESEGTSYFFFGKDSGFEPGNYEVRLFIGHSDTPASVMSFIVAPPQ